MNVDESLKKRKTKLDAFRIGRWTEQMNQWRYFNTNFTQRRCRHWSVERFSLFSLRFRMMKNEKRKKIKRTRFFFVTTRRKTSGREKKNDKNPKFFFFFLSFSKLILNVNQNGERTKKKKTTANVRRFFSDRPIS